MKSCPSLSSDNKGSLTPLNLVGTALQTQLVPKQQLKSGKAAEQLVSWSRSFILSALWKRDHGDMEKTTSAWQKWGTQDSQDPGVLSPILSTDQAEGWPVLGQQLSPRAPAWELVASEVATIRSRLVPSHPHPSRADKHREETK